MIRMKIFEGITKELEVRIKEYESLFQMKIFEGIIKELEVRIKEYESLIQVKKLRDY